MEAKLRTFIYIFYFKSDKIKGSFSFFVCFGVKPVCAQGILHVVFRGPYTEARIELRKVKHWLYPLYSLSDPKKCFLVAVTLE